jgi:glucokinase
MAIALETIQIIKTAGEYLGLGMATVINILNPELIIIGGGTIHYAGYQQAALESA